MASQEAPVCSEDIAPAGQNMLQRKTILRSGTKWLMVDLPSQREMRRFYWTKGQLAERADGGAQEMPLRSMVC
jgi:hypothetical protein